MTGILPISKIRFDVNDQPVGDRYAYLSQATSAVYDIVPHTDRETFDARWTVWKLGDLVFNHAGFSGMAFDNNPHRHGAEDSDYLLLEVYLSGTGHGIVDETPTHIDRHRLHLVDFSRRYRTNTDTVTTKGALIPHAAVGYDPSRHRPYYSVAATSPTGRILITACLSLVDQLDRITEADAPELAAGFAALVQALVICPNSTTNAAGVARARAFAIKAYITGHLEDADLDVARLCRTFNVSRATLYRLFDNLGGIHAYIRRQKLNRCATHLRTLPPTRGQVRRVAETWGFENLSHFHWLFKKQFGVTPSECFDMEPTGSDGSAADQSGKDRMLKNVRDFLRRD